MTYISGTPSIRTRHGSQADAIASNEAKAAAAALGKTLTKAGFPAVNLERPHVRDLRRDKDEHASENEIEERTFKHAPKGRQPSRLDGPKVVAYATDLIMVGWVFVRRRRKPGTNWLAPDSTARQIWGRQPDWNDVIALMKSPSRYRLHRDGECANDAWNDAKDALLRVFKRPPPTGLDVFQETQEGYMKFFFESLGPEELVLVSFHD